MTFSFIIPVYNRPDEIDELLESLAQLDYSAPFEVVIVEDGSTIPADDVVARYNDHLNISYYFKPNSGPGDSRNYGMQKAKGDYFLILDSDCIIPEHYLKEVSKSLDKEFVDCFGGPDAAHHSFSDLQKAIDFSMTSLLTTGGIRGNKKSVDKFQPRSFNMGLSKKAFEVSQGFGKIHPGEDPDLTIRLWKHGFKTKLIANAYVYHKRRISWKKFYVQVNKFGKCRPILNHWHPETKKITYWFPSLFLLGFIFSLGALAIYKTPLFLAGYLLYFILIFSSAFLKTKRIRIACMALVAVAVQFYGYGTGFLLSTYKVAWRKIKPQEAFSYLFFK